jgi:hypothetical protein
MATGTNGIATIGELVSLKGLTPPYPGYDPNKCPIAAEIVNLMGGVINGSYQENQLVRFSDVTKKSSGVLFTITIDNRKSTNLGANLYIADRGLVAPGINAMRNPRLVGYVTDMGVTNHNTGPFDPTESYGGSNVLFWTGIVGFNYSYTAIVGTSGITYSSAGSGIYDGTNRSITETNLKYITLFNQSIQAGDSISLTMTIT